MTTTIVNEQGKIRIIPTGVAPIYAPSNLYSESTIARMEESTRQQTVHLTVDKPDPVLHTDTDNNRTNPKTPYYTLGDPQHHHINIFGAEENATINVGIRTQSERGKVGITLPEIGLGDPQHYHISVKEDKAGATASVNVSGRKVRGGFFSEKDLPLAFDSTKFVPGVYAPEIPSAPGERTDIYAPGSAPVKKRT